MNGVITMQPLGKIVGEFLRLTRLTKKTPLIMPIMDAIDALVIEIFKESSSKRMEELSEFIQDRLTLLWGQCDE
mgnify:CR=1 FL=1